MQFIAQSLFFLEYFMGNSIFTAINSNDLKTVKQLITNGISVDSTNEELLTPLMFAVKKNKIEMVKYLLYVSANPIADGLKALDKAREFQSDPEVFLGLIKYIATAKYYIEADEDDDSDTIVNKLITTLLYKSNRHQWNSDLCLELRGFITALKPAFANKPKIFFNQYITNIETDTNNFYGSYLSDNSDSEDENHFRSLSKKEQRDYLEPAKIFIARGQIKHLTYQKTTHLKQKGDLKILKNGSDFFDLKSRTIIHHHAEMLPKIEQDLERLNKKLTKGIPIQEAVEELQANDNEFTQFFVAEYRGITYQTTKWNQSSRKSHRKDQSELSKPLYSNSVLSASGIGFFRNHGQAVQEIELQKETLETNAKLLQEILLTMRQPKAYTYKNYTYSCLAHLLQNIYTQDYDGFHKLIKDDQVLKHLFLNEYNPFISMGDTPYHAEKYAHGIKPYKGHESYRLRPRWQQNGKAERPYSGVVYASLHPLTDFTKDGPLHVVSLNRNAEIKLQDELIIVAERESCFPAFLPENRVFYKHIAKYPSFNGAYKNIYLKKYGLTKEIYLKFKEQLAHSRPHTKEMTDFKKLLGEWLCSYHEVQCIESARKEAERRGGVLIYRDVNGGFCLQPPVDSVNRNTRQITDEIKKTIKVKQNRRASYVSRTDKIEYLAEDLNNFHFNLDEHGITISEENHSLSMTFSLLLSAITNHHHLALEYYLGKSIFLKDVNQKVTCYRLENASLLHVAVLANNPRAVELLLATREFNPNAVALETTNHDAAKVRFYEDITPLHLAMIEERKEIALKLIENDKVDVCVNASFVDNKDLLGNLAIEPNQIYDECGQEIGELSPEDPGYDSDDLGQGWSCRELYPIRRYKNISALDIAKAHNCPEVMQALKDKNDGISVRSLR